MDPEDQDTIRELVQASCRLGASIMLGEVMAQLAKSGIHAPRELTVACNNTTLKIKTRDDNDTIIQRKPVTCDQST